MNIMTGYLNNGILLYQNRTNKLGFDVNGDKAIQDDEIIIDSNNDGKIDTHEVLDFIVNTVITKPEIVVKRDVAASIDTKIREIQTLLIPNIISKYVSINDNEGNEKATAFLLNAFTEEVLYGLLDQYSGASKRQLSYFNLTYDIQNILLEIYRKQATIDLQKIGDAFINKISSSDKTLFIERMKEIINEVDSYIIMPINP